MGIDPTGNIEGAVAESSTPEAQAQSAPLITVVTPSYNQGRFIRATIESVLSQNYPNLEYIVMDGGSTDETASVVSEYSSRLTWISEKDNGQSHAINKGFKMAKGELVSWLNSDDIIFPGALRLGADGLQQNPGLGAVYGEGHEIHADGTFRQRFPHTQPFDLWRLVHLSDFILQQTSYFRKSVLHEVGYLDESLHYGMDWDLFIRIGKRYEIGYIPSDMGAIREYPEAKSFAGGAKRFAELARLLRHHTGMRYPPGYIVYGLDTYIPIWCESCHKMLTPSLAGLAQKVVRFVGGTIVARVAEKSQGLYADRWAAPKLRYMLSPGRGTVSIRGLLPDLGPAFRRQKIEVICNGRRLGSFPIPIGEFHLRIPVPEDLGSGACSFLLKASRFMVPKFSGIDATDSRRLSYKLESFGWELPANPAGGTCAGSIAATIAR